MTATTTPQQYSDVERALKSLRPSRQSDETHEPETVIARPGYFTKLALSHAQAGPLYSD